MILSQHWQILIAILIKICRRHLVNVIINKEAVTCGRLV